MPDPRLHGLDRSNYGCDDVGTGPLTSSDTSSPIPPPLTRRTAMTTPAPRPAATPAGTGLTMPPSTSVREPMRRRKDARNGRAGEQGCSRATAAEHDFLVRVHVGRDHGHRYRRALQVRFVEPSPDVATHCLCREHGASRHRGPEHLRSELVQELRSFVHATEKRVRTGHDGTDAGAGEEVDGDSLPFEPAQHAEVCVSPQTSRAEGNADLEPDELACQPPQRLAGSGRRREQAALERQLVLG